MADLPDNHIHPLTRDAWRDWLEEHHGRDGGVWLVRYKKATGKPSVSYDEAIEEAMCFGWVDSVPRTLDAAGADGSWSLLDDVENLVVPDDLAAAFEAHPPAAEHWEAFPRSVKRGILAWITQAKRDATRARRIEETASLAARNLRANQWPRQG